MEAKPSVKIPLDMTDVEGKLLLVKLKPLLRSGVLMDAEIDEDEAHHTRLLTLTDPIPANELVPLFDFDYRLAPHGKYHTMTWQGANITYQECIFLYALVMLSQPRTVVETGTGLALSTLHIARALEDSTRGELFTIEHDGNFVRRAVSAVNAYGYKECVTVISQDSGKYLRSWGRPIDLAFIDTGMPQAEKDFECIAPHLKVGGMVVCRHPMPLPGDGQWVELRFPGDTDLRVWSKTAEGLPTKATGESNNAKPALGVPEEDPFVPERTDKPTPKAKAPAAPKKKVAKK